jgi:hypothetical protein
MIGTDIHHLIEDMQAMPWEFRYAENGRLIYVPGQKE